MDDEIFRPSVGFAATDHSDEQLRLIDDRISALFAWIETNGESCTSAQKHLDDKTEPQLYWHYGYLTALRDLRELLFTKRRSIN